MPVQYNPCFIKFGLSKTSGLSYRKLVHNANRIKIYKFDTKFKWCYFKKYKGKLLTAVTRHKKLCSSRFVSGKEGLCLKKVNLKDNAACKIIRAFG
jgi:hypothetical protein